MTMIRASSRTALRAFTVFAAAALLPATAKAADELRYQFKDTKNPIYEVTLTADTPEAIETHTGHITYDIRSVDAANGQITFSYNSGLNLNRQEKHPSNDPMANLKNAMRPPSFPDPWARQPAAPEIVMDPQGTVVRSNRMNEDSHLPYLSGLAWQLVLEKLPTRPQQQWTTESSMTIYEKKTQKRTWPPPPPWQRQQDSEQDRVQHVCKEIIDYTIAGANNNLVTVQRKYDLHALEKVGNDPIYQKTGEGQFVFDKQAGLIVSYNMKYVYQVAADNVTIKVPITVSAKLLRGEELAKFETERKERAERDRVAIEQMQKNQAEQGRVGKMPAGTKSTAMVGGAGGGPFTFVDPDKKPVIGFRVQMFDENNKQFMRSIKPLYEKPADAVPAGYKQMLAKDGYAVGGLTVSGKQWSHAIRAKFVRIKDGKLDMTDAYQSEWIGDREDGIPLTTLAGKGETVVGIYGKQGLNLDGLGLVVLKTDEDIANAPQPGWHLKGKTVSVLNMMKIERGQMSPRDGGAVVVNAHQRLITPQSYQGPVAFRITLQNAGSEMRLVHAADGVTFNWEMNKDELRVDGGPANGQHKKGVGALPVNEWVTIDWVVNEDEMIIFVNNEERYRAAGDFTTINKPFSIISQNGVTKVKSVQVITPAPAGAPGAPASPAAAKTPPPA